MKNSILDKLLPVIIWVFISFLPAIVGGFFKPGIWYMGIIKPEWTPPGWIFGPVWFLLYLIMGLSASIIWKFKNTYNIKLPIVFFIIQLIFNALWSWIFFGRHELLYSVVDIVILLIMIIVTIFLFYRISKKAGLILVPYLLWVGFATILNYNIWLLNR